MEYTTVVYPLRVSFPKGMEICDICPFCHTENSGTRFRCTETGEILPFHNKDYGLRCPLNLDGLKEKGGIPDEEVCGI